jgi:hypothetical protein
MSCAKYSVSADGVPSLIFALPIEAIDTGKALLCFHHLDFETKKTLLPLLNPCFSDLLNIFHYLELNPTWHTFSELATQFDVSRNATIKRCLRLKLGSFPIELTGEAVRYIV